MISPQGTFTALYTLNVAVYVDILDGTHHATGVCGYVDDKFIVLNDVDGNIGQTRIFPLATVLFVIGGNANIGAIPQGTFPTVLSHNVTIYVNVLDGSHHATGICTYLNDNYIAITNVDGVVGENRVFPWSAVLFVIPGAYVPPNT